MGRLGIGIGVPGTGGANPAVHSASAPEDVEIVISADDPRAASRLNSDGNYYAITFPDDYLGGVDLFADARTGSGKIGSGVDASVNLNIILNIPSTMSIGANTAGTVIAPVSGSGGYVNETFVHTDPSIHLRLDTDEWDSSVFDRLNITVNNYGYAIGGGGSGGYGGWIISSGKTTNYYAGDGGGSGQGLHPDWPSGTMDSYYDRADTDYKAGQPGAGYGYLRSGMLAKGANGTFSSTTAGGVGGTSTDVNTGNPAPAEGASRGESGHHGGTVVYISSNVWSSISGTNVDIYNAGWMFAGAGGGSGDQQSGVANDGGSGGKWPGATQGAATTDGVGETGVQAIVSGLSIYVLGGNPGRILLNASANLSVSNTITNVSANTMYGLDGTWTP
jgi:hypothetical protein